jgi:hypothetical protein
MAVAARINANALEGHHAEAAQADACAAFP